MKSTPAFFAPSQSNRVSPIKTVLVGDILKKSRA